MILVHVDTVPETFPFFRGKIGFMKELAMAWRVLKDVFPDVYLFLVSRKEDQDPVSREVLTRLEADPRGVFGFF